MLDTYRNTIEGKYPIIDSKTDVERFARKLGVLKPFETLSKQV